MIQDYFNDCTMLEQLEKKHRTLVLQLHPDRNPDDPNVTREFQEMQAQYEEREAVLNGDYSGSRKARERRERREREEREREERERREREARRVEEVIREARLTTATDYKTWKAGGYVYAHKVTDDNQSSFEWDYLCGDDIVKIVFRYDVESAVVVKIDAIIELGDTEVMNGYLSEAVNGIYGGYEVLKSVGMTTKGKRVPKVVMFRSPHYCFFGNPMGDHVISDYYIPVNYEEMFSDQIHRLAAEQQRKEAEQKRIEAEQRRKIEAEQQPMIAQWDGKLIAVSAALTDDEKETVAVSNLKKMLRAAFPGTAFKVKKHAGNYELVWEDGPRYEEVKAYERLFEPGVNLEGLSPWEERFGHVSIMGESRMMSTLTKATILEQLGSVAPVFTTSGYDDEVEVSDMDWMMLNLMVGKTVEDGKDAWFCHRVNGKRMIQVCYAVQFIFDNTSYVRPKKTTRKKAAKAA